MPKYIVEREIPGAGNWTQEDIAGITEKSCSILKNMGPEIEWVYSYVTDDKVYCLYNAADEQAILDHAMVGGFPANKITEVKNMLKPTV